MVYMLKELVNIKYGKNQKDVENPTGKYPIYGTGGLMSHADKYLYDKPSVLIGRKGSISKVRFSDKPFWTVDTLFYTEVNENIVVPKYLYYKMLTMDMSEYNEGTTIPSLRTDTLYRIELDIPDKKIQKKVVKVLDSLEKKMKTINEINNNLYEISKQLLLRYLDKNKGSDEINISKFLNIFTGKKNANETSPTGKYKFFSCAPESLLSDTYLCDSAAIIVAGNGAYTGRTRFYDGKFELYQRTYGLTLKDGFEKNNIYGLYVFMKTIFEPDKMGGTHGSAIPYIVLSDLTDYKLKYNKVEFDRFSNLVSGNIKMIQENEKSNEKFSELRDTLLPKLMNGEIDLDNIEI